MSKPSGQPPSNPYDFITNPQQAPKKGIGLGNSMLSRIVIVVGGALLLMIIASVVVTIMGRAGQGAANSLKGVLAEQQELIRVSALGAKDALSSDTKGFATTVNMSVTSSQQNIKGELTTIEVTAQELAAKKDEATDKLLEGAKATNSYDTVLQDKLTTLLQTYIQSLQKAYDATSNEEMKLIISDAFDSAQALTAAN